VLLQLLHLSWQVQPLPMPLMATGAVEKTCISAIRGPEITTPSGVTLKGNYHRHEFSYIAPPGDADAGTQIDLRLLSEEFMNLYRLKDGTPGEPELWRRCKVVA
jgi:hypothetical protein